MLSKLKEISLKIENLLENDSFLDGIEPDYLKNAVKDYPMRGGKRIRPAILMWCCGLLGGDVDVALHAAAAIEVFHNWTLVHDDIIDDDSVRRNLPTCHIQIANELDERFYTGSKHSKNFAILVGDIQQAWANDLLLRSSENGLNARLTLELLKMLQRCANVKVISGEALDVELSLRVFESISSEDIMKMFELKTGALIEFAARAGGMIAFNNEEAKNYNQITNLSNFAQSTALAFQLQDDYLGIFGSANKFGKPIGADLKERKATVLVLKALECNKEILQYLGRESYSEQDINAVKNILEETKAKEFVENEIERQLKIAYDNLALFPENEYRQNLQDLIAYLSKREK